MTRSPQSTRRMPITAAAIGIVGVVVVFAMLVLNALNAEGSALRALGRESGYAAIQLGSISVGAILIWRRPENRVGWLFGFVGVMLAFTQLSNEYATYGYVTRDDPGPTTALAAWFSSWVWVPAF